MGIRGELFTTEVSLDNRTYFFNIKENRTGDVFLQVVESKSTDGEGFDRHAIVVFEDDMQKFLQGLESGLKFIEKNRKARSKEAAERSPKKRVVRHAAGKDPSSGTRGEAPSQKAQAPARQSEPAAPRTQPRRVKIIPRKSPR